MSRVVCHASWRLSIEIQPVRREVWTANTWQRLMFDCRQRNTDASGGDGLDLRILLLLFSISDIESTRPD